VDGGLSSGATLSVRRARSDDEAFVLDLAVRFAETRPAWRGEREVTCGTERELHRAFAAPEDGSTVLIAESAAGNRLGFAYLVLNEDFFTKERHGHVSEIAVARDGAGAGRCLMEAAEQYFCDLGMRFVTLNVNESNVRGIAFYERLGFVPQIRQFVKVLGDPRT